MLRQGKKIDTVIRLIANWISSVRLSNSINKFDINIDSEGFCLQLLNLLYDYELVDLNSLKSNFPGIDLGDTSNAKIAFQITSRTDTKKIRETLKMFTEKNYLAYYPAGLRFLILNDTDKLRSAGQYHFSDTLNGFDADKHIIYPQNLVRELKNVYIANPSKFEKLHDLIIRELSAFGNVDFEKSDIVQEYCKQLNTQYDKIELIFPVDDTGLKKVSIDKFYVDLPLEIVRKNIDRDISQSGSENVDVELLYFAHVYRLAYAEEIDRGVRDGADSIFGVKEFRNLSVELLKGTDRAVIIGNPGCGKSTLLQYLIWYYTNWSVSKTERHKIPVILRCRDIKGDEINRPIFDLLELQFSSLQRDKSWTGRLFELIIDAFNAGDVILLIDGIDEIANSKVRADFSNAIVAFSRSFANCSIIVTSRIVGFNSVKEIFGPEFELLSFPDLSNETKKKFIRSCSSAFLGKERSTEIAERLERLIFSSRNLARLSENIFILCIICQLYFDRNYLPKRRIDVYRSVLTKLLERRNKSALIVPVTPNEVFPQLEYVAYKMRSAGKQIIRYADLLGFLNEFRTRNADIQEIEARKPAELVDILTNDIGIINCAGKQYDDRGIEHDVFQFTHQSFQEYLTGQAFLHGWSDNGSSRSHLDILRNIISGEQVEEISIENLEWKKAKEPVLAEFWQDTIRMYIAELDEKDAEACLNLILGSHFLPSGAQNERACAVFAAQCLIEEPIVSNGFAMRIFDELVKNIGEYDGTGQDRNTSLDEVIYSLAFTKWHKEIELTLVEGFLKIRGRRQKYIGSVLSCYYRDSRSESYLLGWEYSEISTRFFNHLHKSRAFEALTVYSLAMMNICFEKNNSFSKKQLRELKSLKKSLFKLLNKQYHRPFDKTSEPLIYSVLWLLGWVTVAKTHNVDKAFFLEESELAHLLRWIEISDDEQILYWLVLLLSQRKGIRFDEDWMQIFAYVANGDIGRDQMQPHSATGNYDCTRRLLTLLTTTESEDIRKVSALTLVRLCYFGDIVVDPLFEIFLDAKEYQAFREEAFVHLTLSGQAIVKKKFSKVFLKQCYDEENDWVVARCYISLVWMADVEKIKGKIERDQLLLERIRKAVKKIVASKIVTVLLVRGENLDGNKIWAYVGVRGDRLEQFMIAQTSGTFYPEEFGIIIFNGLGEEPPAEIRRTMEKDYGFNHQSMVDIPDAKKANEFADQMQFTYPNLLPGKKNKVGS